MIQYRAREVMGWCEVQKMAVLLVSSPATTSARSVVLFFLWHPMIFEPFFPTIDVLNASETAYC
jgi:hypothetical protein